MPMVVHEVRFATTAFTVAIVLAPLAARADDTVDQPAAHDVATEHRIDRTWAYADDARVAAPMTVIGTTSFSYTEVGSSPSRIASPYPITYTAFAANTAQPGAMMGLGGELGLVSRLSVTAMGELGMGATEGATPSAGAVVGLRLQVSPPSWRDAHVVLSAGYLREAWSGPIYDAGKWLPGSPEGDNGAWIQGAFSADIRRLRLATTLHAEHVFWPGRDPLDVMAELGASFRVIDAFRLGVEYVGQDLEESLGSGAEGGARHLVGPTASVQLLGERLSIVAGASAGLSVSSPDFLGRAGLSYGF
jgi:hypothetical protein